MSSVRFADRRDGGRQLATSLTIYAGRNDAVVLALPRGGVPVGYEVALALGLPLDICTVRKLGFPGHVELAMGAVAAGGVCIINDELVARMGVSHAEVERVVSREREEIARRERSYRGSRRAIDPHDKVILLVDDGLATGASMSAAVMSLRGRHAARIVVAVPVASPRTCSELGNIADDVICFVTPAPFRAVSVWYDRFEPTTDEEVRELLAGSG